MVCLLPLKLFMVHVRYLTYLFQSFFQPHQTLSYTGLLIGCGKKWEILWHFQGKLYGKKGLLCGKLCDFSKADLTLFF